MFQKQSSRPRRVHVLYIWGSQLAPAEEDVQYREEPTFGWMLVGSTDDHSDMELGACETVHPPAHGEWPRRVFIIGYRQSFQKTASVTNNAGPWVFKVDPLS
jgi:hypothetical protein